jgi:hypothetical protein
MTVADSDTRQVFFVTVERLALVQRAVAVLADTPEEAEALVLNGEGLDIGYLGGTEVNNETKIVDVGYEDEIPAGLSENVETLRLTLREINGR